MIVESASEDFEGRLTPGIAHGILASMRTGVKEELIAAQKEQDRQTQARLEQLLREGLASRMSEMTAQDWDGIRREVHERHASRPPQ